MIKSVFEFTDFRQYLKEYYEFSRQSEKGFSYRRMAQILGFSSPNFMKLVIDDERNISDASVQKLINGLNFNKKEAEYFAFLVKFTLAKNSVQKDYYFSLITSLRSKRNIAPITRTQIEYLNEWYNPVVRELVVGLSDPLDYEKISVMMFHGVSSSRIKRSVDLLKQLGLLHVDADGIYCQSSALLDTGDDMCSHAIRSYHKNIFDIAKTSLDTIPVEEREINSLTIRVSESGFHLLKNRLQEIRKSLLDFVAQDKNTDRVYALCFQLFPMAKTKCELLSDSNQGDKTI
jgi:uncharacterized protein (TIGR02147 family)